MNDEIDAIKENNTWTLTSLPKDRKAIGSKWVYKIKRDSNGKIDRYKARIVAKGYSQVEGIDYFDTFAPVVKLSSIRVIFAIANIKGWIIHQMDVVLTFLNGDLLEEVYMEQPKGIIENPNLVCKLNKSLYGLKQASRTWYQKIDNFLLEKGLKRLESDHNIFVMHSSKQSLLVAIYVDDLLITSSDLDCILHFKVLLGNQFKMKDLGVASFILGIKIERNNNELYLSQEEYLTKVLNRFGMHDKKPVTTPLNLGTKNVLSNDSDNPLDCPYKQALGSLMYAMLCT